VNGVPAPDVPPTGEFTASDRGWQFAGSLVFDDAAGVLEASRELALPESGIVDMSGLTHADSAALAVVIALKRRAVAEGRKLAIEGLPSSLHSLAVVYGVEDLLA
jgi:phospholipid transport system transporter-binding protein